LVGAAQVRAPRRHDEGGPGGQPEAVQGRAEGQGPAGPSGEAGPPEQATLRRVAGSEGGAMARGIPTDVLGKIQGVPLFASVSKAGLRMLAQAADEIPVSA